MGLYLSVTFLLLLSICLSGSAHPSLHFLALYFILLVFFVVVFLWFLFVYLLIYFVCLFDCVIFISLVNCEFLRTITFGGGAVMPFTGALPPSCPYLYTAMLNSSPQSECVYVWPCNELKQPVYTPVQSAQDQAKISDRWRDQYSHWQSHLCICSIIL